jgi:hypothetical protein
MIPMKSFFFLVLALIPALFISCNRENSDTVQQDLIYQTYTLVYNGSEDKTYARASYRFSNGLGTLLFLSGGATVQFNGQPMDWKNLLAYYELEFPGNLSAGVFEYSDADGNLFTNPISQVDSIAFPANFTSLTQNTGSYTLNWVGPVLMNGHDVLVSIDGTFQNDLNLFTATNPGSNSVVLEANKINALGPGTADAWMHRNFTTTLTEATSAGGSLSSRFEAPKTQISVQ